MPGPLGLPLGGSRKRGDELLQRIADQLGFANPLVLGRGRQVPVARLGNLEG